MTSTLATNLLLITFFIFAAVSAITAVLFYIDKRAAIDKRWRVSERQLLIASFLCGWPGALVARKLFRHKTKKWSFVLRFWCVVLANLIAVITLFTRFFSLSI